MVVNKSIPCTSAGYRYQYINRCDIYIKARSTNMIYGVSSGGAINVIGFNEMACLYYALSLSVLHKSPSHE